MRRYKYGKEHSKKLFLTPKEASKMPREGAEAMGIELGECSESDLKKVRKILSKGTPLSTILLEMRGRA